MTFGAKLYDLFSSNIYNNTILYLLVKLYRIGLCNKIVCMKEVQECDTIIIIIVVVVVTVHRCRLAYMLGRST